MKKQYGERGEEVFYRSINKGVPGSSKWHGKSKHSKHSVGNPIGVKEVRAEGANESQEIKMPADPRTLKVEKEWREAERANSGFGNF